MENISDERMANGFIVASRLLANDLSVTALRLSRQIRRRSFRIASLQRHHD